MGDLELRVFHDRPFIKRTRERIERIFMTDMFYEKRFNDELFRWVLLNPAVAFDLAKLVLNTDEETLRQQRWSIKLVKDQEARRLIFELSTPTVTQCLELSSESGGRLVQT